MKTDSPWTEAELEALAKEWAFGTPCSQIAKMMKRSKNSIIGKARRLALPARANPASVCGTLATKPARVQRAPKTKLPQIPAAPALAVQRAPGIVYHTCQWVIYPVRFQQRFCDAVAAEGRPYCAEHCKLAYVSAAA